jgi:Tfp pilus assembly protein PilF
MPLVNDKAGVGSGADVVVLVNQEVASDGSGRCGADGTEAMKGEPQYALFRVHGGRAANAIADLTEAIRLDPDDAISHATRSATYMRMGEKAKAEADFATAEKLGHVRK